MYRNTKFFFLLLLITTVYGCGTIESNDELCSKNCEKIAYEYLKGKNRPKSLEKAYLIYERECKNGKKWSCFRVGDAKNKGEFYETDYVEAASYYERACNLHLSHGCSELGALQFEGKGIKRNVKLAYKNFQLSCEPPFNNRWDAVGCSKLAYIYYLGIGVSKNKHRASELYKKGCQLNNAWSCVQLANIYKMGDGIEENQKQAQYFYTRACLFKDADQCFELGEYYRSKPQKHKDWLRAVSYYANACEYDNEKYCMKVANIYRYDKTSKNQKKFSYLSFRVIATI